MKALRDGLRSLRLKLDASLKRGEDRPIFGLSPQDRIYALTEAGAYYGANAIVTVPDSGVNYVRFSAGNQARGQLVLTALASCRFSAFLERDVVIAAGGDQVIIAGFNLRRSVGSTLSSTRGLTVTSVEEGELVAEWLVPGGRGPQAVGGSTSIPPEIIVPAGASFVIRITNLTNQDTLASVAFNFYEDIED